MRIAVVVGNPKARSRTLSVADAVATAAAGAVDDSPTGSPWIWPKRSGAVRLVVGASGRSSPGRAPDLVIVASPTYKATYTGLLKAFLDWYRTTGSRQVAVPVMTGAGPVHALAPELHLRPLLVELGARVPTRGLYVTEDRLGELESTVDQWGVAALPILRRALG